MNRLPMLNVKTLERVLHQLGFSEVRRKGSHVFYRHLNGKTTTIPHHTGRDLARPLLREILREIHLTPGQFLDELNNL